ncbi:MAG TPA: hypothetical protein PKH99_00450 [Vicinamibacterales bacterium]|nr:hypothetical protein [Vicinamibacterales bacterium]
MLPRQPRVGDLVDDYCPRERRLSNHAVVALVGDDIRQVRCTTCDAEHEYRGGRLPAPRKKAAIAAALPLPPARAAAQEPRAGGGEAGRDAPAVQAAAAGPEDTADSVLARAQHDAPAPGGQPAAPAARAAESEVSLHRRLIRATLPRVEGDVPPRPIPEFIMHKAAPAGNRRGKPFRHGQAGRHKPGAKGGPRQNQGEVDGNSIHYRGGQGHFGFFGPPGAPGGRRATRPPHGQRGGQGHPPGRGPRHGFGGKPPRGPKKR